MSFRNVVLLVILVTVAVTSFPPSLRANEGAPSVEEQAQALYGEGEAAYAAGQYNDALQSFIAAYELIPVAGLLFNIGQAHRKLGHHREAADFFQRYLNEESEAIPNKAEVVDLIREESRLADEERAAAAAAANASSTPPAPTRSAPAIYEEPAFWGIAGGVALAALVGGAVIAVVASTPPPSGSLGTFDLRAQ